MPFGLNGKYFNFDFLYVFIFLSYIFDEQNIVISYFSHKLSTKYSARVSNPPYFEGNPCIPMIAIFLLICNKASQQQSYGVLEDSQLL